MYAQRFLYVAGMNPSPLFRQEIELLFSYISTYFNAKSLFCQGGETQHQSVYYHLLDSEGLQITSKYLESIWS